MGKTWAVVGWMIGRAEDLPIVVIAPSAAVAGLQSASEAGVKRLLAERLQELSPQRDRDFWLRRLDRLLERPADERPGLVLLLDGLNQEPAIDWLRVLKVLQGPAFAGRIRVIATTRNLHFEDRLAWLRGLTVQPARIGVEPYSLGEDGELAQMLAFEGLTLADLHPDLLPLARTPRLFHLVVRFRDRLVDAGQVTVHRLLWEYGRDSLGERAGRSFSEGDWREWLQEVAARVRTGMVPVPTRQLEEMVARPGLAPSEVYARLSDVVDGQFAHRTATGTYVLSPSIVNHALAAALLEDLAGADDGRDAAAAALAAWLDPIAGLDQRAEILRAAVSISVEAGKTEQGTLPGVLIAAWLQTQNMGPEHRLELQALASELCEPLLDALELSRGPSGRSATSAVVNALRVIPRSNDIARDRIVQRVASWFSIVSRDLSERGRHPDLERHRAERLEHRVGCDRSGPLIVLGQSITLVDDEAADLRQLSASLLEGFPLAPAMPALVMAAFNQAIGGHTPGWDGLKWLCLLNPQDPAETAQALRTAAEAIADRSPEPGVAAGLPGRVAALLLWLTGCEADDEAANSVDSGIDRWLSYEEDYEKKPGRSFLRLERRHAEEVLSDNDLPLRARLDRVDRFWADPSFQAPPACEQLLAAEAEAIDVAQLHSHNATTEIDYRVEKLELPLARAAPAALERLAHRQQASLAQAAPEARYWKAVTALQSFVVADGDAAEAARTLRLSGREPERGNETAATSYLLMLEIWDKPAFDQFAALIDADLRFILLEFMELLRQPSAEDVERLIARSGSGSDKVQRDLLTLLSCEPTHLGEAGWSWVEAWLDRATSEDARGQAFQTLDRCDAPRLGRILLERGWNWGAQEHIWANHHGSNALIEATLGLPFDEVVSRLAPWRVLEAARRRGNEPSEVQLAAEVFGGVLAVDSPEAPDLGSDVRVDVLRSDGALATLSVSVRETELDEVESLRRAFDVDAQREERKRAADIAFDRIREARRMGVDLLLMNFDPDDFEGAIRFAEAEVLRWISGTEEVSAAFRSRVSRSEGAFLALCEAMLRLAPTRGAALWRALSEVMATRYIGMAGVNERLHMLFRVPSSEPIEDLRRAQLDPAASDTDRKLIDLALAAGLAGQREWLEQRIAEDVASPLPWRQRRGITLSGFVIPGEADVAAPWDAGEARSSFEEARREAARRRHRARWAREWWRAYVEAATPQDALAAWIVFRDTADDRAWAWVAGSLDKEGCSDAFRLKRAAHAQLNLSDLKRKLEKGLRAKEDELFGRKIVGGVGPWRETT